MSYNLCKHPDVIYPTLKGYSNKECGIRAFDSQPVKKVGYFFLPKYKNDKSYIPSYTYFNPY